MIIVSYVSLENYGKFSILDTTTNWFYAQHEKQDLLEFR